VATILVVDDEPTVLRLCQRMLQLGGSTVLTAQNGPEALRALQDSGVKVDLSLVDLVMPEMNGIELAARMKAAAPAMPIVLMTGYSLREVRQLVGGDAPYRIIWKPFKTESLLRMIENALQGSGTDSSGESMK